MGHNFMVLSQILNSFCGKNYWKLILQACLVFSIFIPAGCGGNSGRPAGAIPRTATVSLPTQAPTPRPSPASTRVLPVEVLTPPPSPTITPIPDETMGLVVDVIDGNTIAVVMDGDPASRAYVVRYIGVEAPLAANPWGLVAYEKNHELTNLKVVRLVRDETDFDAEGNLLRHVYIDNQLLSVILAEQGLAKAAIEEPNTRFASEIRAAEARAKESDLGLWGPEPPTPTATRGRPSAEGAEATVTETPSPTAETTLTATLQATQTITVTGTATGTLESAVEPTTEGTPESE